MHRLGSTAEKKHLDPGQTAEEKIRSVDYDVWECAAGHHLPLAYANPDSGAKECPACHRRTLGPGRLRIEKAATIKAEGWGWRVEKCSFCQHEEKVRETISRLPDPAERAAGSSSAWGSSSGSSGSSSSTSSGGSSGGGGAGSSW